MFTKFAEMQTLRQVHLWLRQERITFPAVGHGPEGRHVEWKLPVYNTIHHILTNPTYAGAYVFGRSGSRVTIEAGRKRIVRGFRRERNDWEVLIKDHHEGYITWAEFDRNQRLITDSANGKSFMSRGSVRRGEGLLAGFFVAATAAANFTLPTAARTIIAAVARSTMVEIRASHSAVCARIARSARRSSRGCSRWVYRRRWRAMEARGREHTDKLRQLELILEQARYEATRARRRYEAVDPENRLVAGELDRRWNERLIAVRELEGERETLLATPEMTLSDIDRDRLLALGADLERDWESPGATAATRKRIIRSLIHEIVVRIRDEVLDLIVHWHGGDHTHCR